MKKFFHSFLTCTCAPPLWKRFLWVTHFTFNYSSSTAKIKLFNMTLPNGYNSLVATGALVGLSPQNKALSPPNWNVKHYKWVLVNFQMPSPPKQTQSPPAELQTPCWKLSGDGSGLQWSTVNDSKSHKSRLATKNSINITDQVGRVMQIVAYSSLVACRTGPSVWLYLHGGRRLDCKLIFRKSTVSQV